MSELNLQVDQISEETVLIVVRSDFSRFNSLEEAKRAQDQLREWQSRINKPILFIDHSFDFEQMDDEQLLKLGLQRVNQN